MWSLHRSLLVCLLFFRLGFLFLLHGSGTARCQPEGMIVVARTLSALQIMRPNLLLSRIIADPRGCASNVVNVGDAMHVCPPSIQLHVLEELMDVLAYDANESTEEFSDLTPTSETLMHIFV